MRPLALLTAVFGALAGCTETTPEIQATLLFRIDEAACAAYCVDEARALFSYLGQPAAEETWTCQESHESQAYQAGAVVGVEVETYATGVDTVLLYEAPAQDVVVPATGPVQVTVTLEPRFAPALLDTSPDPAKGGETLTVTTSDVFPGAGKPGALTLDGAALPLPVAAWSAPLLEITLPSGAAGSALGLSYCGRAAEPLAVRIFAGALAPHSTALGKPCSAQALVPEPATGKLLVAGSCADGSGTVRALTPEGCAVESLLETGAGVVSVAPGAGGGAFWAVLEGGALVEGGAGTPVGLPEAGQAVAVASAGPSAYAAVAHLDGTFALHAYAAEAWSEIHRDSFPLLALAAAGTTVAGLGASGGELRLVARVGSADPAIYPAAECQDPAGLALTEDGATAAVTCRGMGAAAVIWIRTFVQFEALVPSGLALSRPESAAFDPAGDVLYVYDAGPAAGQAALVALRVSDGVERARWAVADALAPAPLATFPGDARFALQGARSGTLRVLTPYAVGPVCP